MATLIICNSNIFVPTVLTMIKEGSNSEFVIISDTENISIFFNKINIPNVFFVKYKQPSIWDINKSRKSFFQDLFSYKIEKVYFFHTEFGGIANWLIKFLSSKVPIYFCKIFEMLPNEKAKISLRSVKMWGTELMKTHVSMEILDTGYRLIPSLPIKFYRKVKAQQTTVKVNYNHVSQLVQPLLGMYDIADRKYVLLTGSAVPTGLVAETEYTEKVNSVIKTLGSSSVLSKCHPRFCNKYGMENEIAEIPSFIPGNVILNCYRFYLGLESTLLVEAALMGKVSISLIEMMDISDVIKKDISIFFKSRLQNKGEILFPKNVEDLKNIIKKCDGEI